MSISDPDVSLSRTLYDALLRVARDPTRPRTSVLPRMLPALLDPDLLCNSIVLKLLIQLAPYMVTQLFADEKVDVLVTLLMYAI